MTGGRGYFGNPMEVSSFMNDDMEKIL